MDAAPAARRCRGCRPGAGRRMGRRGQRGAQRLERRGVDVDLGEAEALPEREVEQAVGDPLADRLGPRRGPERRLAVGFAQRVGRPRRRYRRQSCSGATMRSRPDPVHGVQGHHEVDRQPEPALQEAIAAERRLDAVEIEIAARAARVGQRRRRLLRDDGGRRESGRARRRRRRRARHGQVAAVDGEPRAGLGVVAPGRRPRGRPRGSPSMWSIEAVA